MEALTIQNLSFSYPRQPGKAIDGLTLTVEQGAFLVLCGPSGCGKSTLLRHCKPALAPHGSLSGDILFEGTPLAQIDRRTQSQSIGFVQQSPEHQLVTDKVWHELAFGLESLGCDTPTIRRRVAEMACFFGIEGWFYQSVSQLSGGQKQLLSLASVMAMQPSLLILDEPTGQLDPIAASDFLSTLGKINRELGTTILLSEHRLEDAFPLATQVAVMDAGRLLATGTPHQVGAALGQAEHGMFLAMPTALRVWASVNKDGPCPVTVREGRDWLTALARERALQPLPLPQCHVPSPDAALEAKSLWFRYEPDGADVVKGLSLTVQRGEFLALLGGNGAGKTTGLMLLAGLRKPYRGTVALRGSLGLLPQNPQALFVKKTVREDLWELLQGSVQSRQELESRVARVVSLCRLEALLERHPYDLSGGEQQRAALAKVLLTQPDILLLDEPTKGLDAQFKQTLAEILTVLLRRGVAVVMVSHDLEFCAQHAHRCALFFDGGIVTQAPPRDFFSGNSFYTTSANRMARSLLPQAVTAEDLMAACGGTLPQTPALPEDIPPLPEDLPPPADPPAQSLRAKPQPSRRSLVGAALILLLIPLTLFVGVYCLEGRRYYFISLLILLESMAPFFLVFEGRKPPARELVIIAVLCALAVAGRAALFMLPQFKPVMALTILAGVALGRETGFLVGAMSMLSSNVLFSQGPWTPWQMFAMGIIGFLAGVLFRKGRLRRSRGALACYGAVAAIVLYGGIMNPASALMWAGSINGKILLTYCLSGLPMDCVQAAATALFLFLAARPMLEKLERIRLKYGLAESRPSPAARE